MKGEGGRFRLSSVHLLRILFLYARVWGLESSWHSGQRGLFLLAVIVKHGKLFYYENLAGKKSHNVIVLGRTAPKIVRQSSDTHFRKGTKFMTLLRYKIRYFSKFIKHNL